MDQFFITLSNNFWQLFMITTFFLIKKYRGAGLVLLLSLVLFGYKKWVFATILIILIIGLFFETATSDTNKKQPRRQDPDYM